MLVPQSTTLFALIAGAGGATAVVFSAFFVGESWGMYPTTLSPADFDAWRKRQLIQDAHDARKQSLLVVIIGIVPLAITPIVRLGGAHIELSLPGMNAVVGIGFLLTLAGTTAGLFRARHSLLGNDQKGIRCWEAWSSAMAISLYTISLLLVLPT